MVQSRALVCQQRALTDGLGGVQVAAVGSLVAALAGALGCLPRLLLLRLQHRSRSTLRQLGIADTRQQHDTRPSMAVQQTNVSARRATALGQWSVWQHVGDDIGAHSNLPTPTSQPVCHLRDVGGVAGGVRLLLQLGHALLLATHRRPQRLQLALHTVKYYRISIYFRS